jgi:hypothetical protein
MMEDAVIFDAQVSGKENRTQSNSPLWGVRVTVAYTDHN